MKKLLILLFSLFLLSSSSVFADDISDFTIEGMSIGDSLLDYMTEEEILEEIEKRKDYYHYYNEPNKYAEIYLFKDFPTYDGVSFFIKNNTTNIYVGNKNEKYTILAVRGLIHFNEDFDSCVVKRDEIAEILSSMFPNAKKTTNVFAHSIDPSGISTVDGVYFKLNSEVEIEATCLDFEETLRIKNRWNDALSIIVLPKEIYEWMSDY